MICLVPVSIIGSKFYIVIIRMRMNYYCRNFSLEEFSKKYIYPKVQDLNLVHVYYLLNIPDG